jgi:fructose-1,6-bisphosphatase/inositol monophosphatase family enzyme/glycerophosphoryl diester phosphodiesterase
MPFACAHRGNSSLYRENTIEAISSAIDSGADVVEIDVRMSSDGEVVVIHDPTLERLWGVNKPVNSLSWSEISQIRSDGYRIPLLKEVIALFVGKKSLLMIDMEPADPALHALREVQGSELPITQVTWCGNDDAMVAIKKAASEARIWLAWDSLELPTSADIAGIKPEFLNFQYSFVDSKMVQAAHDLGCKVSVWTVQDAPTMRWACAVGVDSITSDFLPMLQDVIREKPSFDNQPPKQVRQDEIDLALAEEVATGLGKWAAQVTTWFDPGKMSFKTNAGDIVTAIDLLIETHVREVIKANLKGHNLVGEEFGGKAINGVPNWYLDPIDGTTNFANRVPWSSFSLAMAYESKPLVGVVTHPWIDRVYTAVSGKGAKCNGKPISLANETGTTLSSRIVSTELMAYQPWPGMDRFLDELAERYCTMRIMGSGTLTLLGVAANHNIGAVISEFSPIDHLAAVLIVSESGGVVLNEDGIEDLFPKNGGVLCATKGVARELFEIWKESRL